jgi:signal transduction histidine kinase
LAFIRSQQGLDQLSLASIKVPTLLNSVVKTFQHQFKAKKIAFTISAESVQNLDVELDPDKIQQVLNNLLANALKYTDPKGSVHVTASHQDWMLVVRVSDTGRGIDRNLQEKVFERGFQTQASDSASGVGLGLAIVKHYVEMHGGKVWLNSTVGIGSEFTFEIPVVGSPKGHSGQSSDIISRNAQTPGSHVGS